MPENDGVIIDKATRFGERFGFPALIAMMLTCGAMYGAYFIVRYEVFYNRGQVEAMALQVSDMITQHSTILAKQEASIDLLVKQVNISCAQCWNVADNQTEIKRCACTPSQ
jgi:hypothetical protein